MMRYAAWAIALAVSTVLAAAPARADHGFGGHHGGFHHRFRDHRFDRRHFFVRPFFPPVSVFGRTVFVPAPVALPPPVVPPPPLSYPGYFAAPPPCYQYQTTVIIAGRPQPAFGTACLQPDGTWRIVP